VLFWPSQPNAKKLAKPYQPNAKILGTSTGRTRSRIVRRDKYRTLAVTGDFCIQMTRLQAPTYIHGSAPDEQRRLSVLNGILNEACLRELGLRGGERILDIGSGLGQFTRALARAALPGGRVIGIEQSPAQLAEARKLAALDREGDLADFREGDALALPLRPEEWGTFDLAHTRFLLEHVSDPLAVVRLMVRAVRPGGRIALADDDHDMLRLWPEPPGFIDLWQAYIRTYERLQNDPLVGRRLISILHAAGAAPARNTWVFFGSCAGSPAFPAVVDNLISVLAGAREAIFLTVQSDEGWFDRAIAALTEWSRRPDAAVWYALSWAEGLRPAIR
jgi:SAM-dependent methyltransferase